MEMLLSVKVDKQLENYSTDGAHVPTLYSYQIVFLSKTPFFVIESRRY